MILHDGPAVLGFEPWREIDAPILAASFLVRSPPRWTPA